MLPIRTALVGFGIAGRVFHAPLITAHERFSLDAIATGSPDHAEAARAAYPDARQFDDVDQVFAAADDFDLVVIATPNATHAPLATLALDAGLNVIVDKPIAVTSTQARELAAHAEAAGRMLTVFQNRRWDGDFTTIADAIADGLVGDVWQFDSAFEWWKPELTSWWRDTTLLADGGGILYDLGPHLIDQALRLFGEIEDVHAELDMRRVGAVNDDDSFVSVRHANGVRTRLWMSATAPANRPRFRVVGSKATLTTWGLDPQEPQSIAGLRPLDEGFGVHEDGRTAVLETPDGATEIALKPGRYLSFYDGVAAALRDGAPAPVDPHTSIAALETIERAIRSVSR